MNKDSILAIDIGAGTQDILLYDPSESMENAVKLVLPSPTRIAAHRIRAVTGQKEPLFETALDKYFGGKMDEKTLSILNV